MKIIVRYTEEDIKQIDEIIMKEYSRRTAYTVAFLGGEKFSCSFVKKRARLLGFKTYKTCVDWTLLDIEYIKENYPQKSLFKLTNFLDVDIDELRILIRKLGIYNNNNHRYSRLRNVLGECTDDYNSVLSSIWNIK